MDKGHEHPGAGRTDRVPEGDAAATDVQDILGDPEFLGVAEDLGGERLVELEEIDIVDCPSRLVECAPDARNRGGEDVLRINTRGVVADDLA